uniref:Fibrinogen C-terminal domain-containing protein n=1 Tax=Plectus sambesii TaxID=2011161 RepID=A0A914WFR8_9BILA
MDTNGGGWTVFQKRVDDSLTFYTKTWAEYKNGFDNGLTRNFWLGNDKIHALSSKDSKVDLRIDLWGDRDPNPNATPMYKNAYFFAEYTNFAVDNEANKYTLHLSPFVSGNASYQNNNIDIIWSNGRPFSTFDQDNDGGDCANPDENSMQLGGWWANWVGRCGYCALNGKYVPSVTFNSFFGMNWFVNTGPLEGRKYIQPVQSQMKMRKVA